MFPWHHNVNLNTLKLIAPVDTVSLAVLMAKGTTKSMAWLSATALWPLASWWTFKTGVFIKHPRERLANLQKHISQRMQRTGDGLAWSHVNLHRPLPSVRLSFPCARAQDFISLNDLEAWITVDYYDLPSFSVYCLYSGNLTSPFTHFFAMEALKHFLLPRFPASCWYLKSDSYHTHTQSTE